jgi:hypothetical protein
METASCPSAGELSGVGASDRKTALLGVRAVDLLSERR